MQVMKKKINSNQLHDSHEDLFQLKSKLIKLNFPQQSCIIVDWTKLAVVCNESQPYYIQ